MRDAIAGAWLYSLILIFMVILVAFISISLNYNKTYKLKTTVVNLIEENQGVNPQTVASIGKFLNANGYNSKNVCKEVVRDKNDANKEIKYVGISQNAGEAQAVFYSTKDATDVPQQHVCITREDFKGCTDCGGAISGTSYIDHYYNVYMFFNFSLPIFGNIFIFKVIGSTNSIYYPVDTYWGNV